MLMRVFETLIRFNYRDSKSSKGLPKVYLNDATRDAFPSLSFVCLGFVV